MPGCCRKPVNVWPGGMRIAALQAGPKKPQGMDRGVCWSSQLGYWMFLMVENHGKSLFDYYQKMIQKNKNGGHFPDSNCLNLWRLVEPHLDGTSMLSLRMNTTSPNAFSSNSWCSPSSTSSTAERHLLLPAVILFQVQAPGIRREHRNKLKVFSRVLCWLMREWKMKDTVVAFDWTWFIRIHVSLIFSSVTPIIHIFAVMSCLSICLCYLGLYCLIFPSIYYLSSSKPGSKYLYYIHSIYIYICLTSLSNLSHLYHPI